MSIIKQDPKNPDRFIEYGHGKAYFYKGKPELKDLFQYTDKPIAVIGPAPSVMEDVAKLPEECIYYAVNFHFLEKGLFDFEYLSFLDKPDYGPDRVKKIDLYSRFKGKKITNHLEWTDIYCVNEEPLMCSDSGIFSLWVALYLTSGPVYACGMDNRSSARMYNDNSHCVNRRADWEEPKVVKYGRWHMLMERGYKPERLHIFNDGVAKFLSDRGHKFVKV